MFGKDASEEMEVTRLKQNEAMTIEAKSCGALYQTDISFRESDDGTVVRMTTAVKPLTLMAKLTAPLGWMMSGMLKRCLAKDLADIKQAVEAS
jgi:hypothetical protein